MSNLQALAAAVPITDALLKILNLNGAVLSGNDNGLYGIGISNVKGDYYQKNNYENYDDSYYYE